MQQITEGRPRLSTSSIIKLTPHHYNTTQTQTPTTNQTHINMSDLGRKDFGDKAKESFTPDSSKSTGQKVKEGVTDTTDKVSRGVVPDSQKSGGQSVADKAGRSKDDAAHGGSGGSVIDKTKNALGLGDKH